MSTVINVPPGLRNVVVTETTLGDVRGDEGFYHYRQYSAIDLAKSKTLEDVWYLMFEGRLPTDAELITVTTAAKAGTSFAFPTSGVYAWTTNNWFGAGHITRNLATGGFGVTGDTSPASAVCVR